MKQFYLLALALVLSCATSLNAQTWTNLGSLLDVFTAEQESDFTEDLGELSDELFLNPNDGLRLSDFDFDLAQDSFFHYFNNDPIANADTFGAVWDMHEGTLGELFANIDFTAEDSTTIADSYYNVDSLWVTELDSLNAVIDGYQDSLGQLDTRLISSNFTRFDVSQGVLVQLFGSLEDDYFPPLLDENTNEGEDAIADAVENTLFDSALDIELAFGQEWSRTRFYNEAYDVRASLIRIASVPKFDQLFEFRWSLQGSFFNRDEDLILDEQQNLDTGLNPFICNGDAAVMYTPMLGCFNGIFNLYTSIGIEGGTYVPSHRIEGDPIFGDRVGNTTGFGPQLGVGFSVARGNMTMYSYGTIARGDIINSPDGFEYQYNSMVVNAGVRLGNAVNFMYSYGDYSWAPDLNKSAVFSRFTVGIILDELNN